MSNLLKEGGAGDHMVHPFNLKMVKSGEDLKDWFGLAIDHLNDETVEKKPTVKIDGANLSFKVITTPTGKKAFAVDRGSVQLIDLVGVTADRAEERFPPNKKTGEPHGMVAATKTLLEIFNKALPSIEPELKKLKMWDDPTYYFNTEYVLGGKDKSSNVLKYKENSIFLHGIKRFYKRYDKKTGEALPGRDGEGALDRPRDPETNRVKQVVGHNVPFNREALEELKDKVNKIAPKYGFKVYTFISPTKKDKKEIDKSILDKALNTPFPVKYIDRVDQKTLNQRLSEIHKNPYGILIPFAGKEGRNSMLRDIYLAVLNGEIPIDQLTEEEEHQKLAIDGAVMWHATRLMGNEILNILETEKHGDMSAHEGLVLNDPKRFKTENDVKISGEFIVIGMQSAFQKKPMNEEIEEKKLLVLLPGGYKPPTKGHYEMIKYYNDQPDVEKILVLVGPGKRDGIGRDTAEKVFKHYGIEDFEKVSVEPTDSPSPIGAAYDFLDKDARREDYKHLVFSMGASDKPNSKGVPDFKRAEDFVARYDKVAPPEGFEVGIPPCCPAVGEDAPLSATNLRKAIEDDDLDLVRQLIPDHIDPEELVSIVKGLQEMSSMAGGQTGGDVQGYSLPIGMKPEYPEDDEEELEEQKIRELVRRGLKIIMEEENREQKLRTIVRKLIGEKMSNKILQEQEEEMAVGAHSTAINYLEKVLKSVIPGKSGGSQLEPEYVSLSRPEQRKSFIKHVIQGLYDELAPNMSLTGLLSRFEKRREQFDAKEADVLMTEAEELTIKLDDDGLPEVEIPEEEKEEPTDDFPEEKKISGENSIGRKAAYRFIKGQIDTIQTGLNDLEETHEEREERKQTDPNSADPQEEYLDFLFTNLMLHAYRLENKHFNSINTKSEDFFRDIVSRADQEKSAGEEDIEIGDDIGIEPDEPEETDLDLTL